MHCVRRILALVIAASAATVCGPVAAGSHALLDIGKTRASMPGFDSGPRVGADTVSPRPAAAPEPATSVAPSACRESARRARIVGEPARLDYPEAALRANLVGVAIVLVALNADGSVHSVSVERSTGDASLDDAALAAAAGTTYEPETRFCVGIPSRYLFEARFTGR